MARVIAISNQKGGVGKTTTSVNLAASLAAAEKKVLLLDLDPQGNAGSGLGFYPSNKYVLSLYHVIVEEVAIVEAIRHTELNYLDLVPASKELIGAEIELISVIGRETRLKEALEPIQDKYDFILIDCPPTLSILTINALTAANSVLIPLQCEYYAMEGLSQLIKTISLIQKRLNPTLKKEGILLTMYDKRNNLSYQVESEIRSHFKSEVFDVVIPRNVKLSEAPSYGKPIILYDITSAGACAYLELAKELINKYDDRISKSKSSTKSSSTSVST